MTHRNHSASRASLALVFLLACVAPSAQVIPQPEVSPAQLDFGDVPVGGERHLPLRLRNPSRVTLQVTAETSAPFSLARPIELSAGEQRDVTVVFAPEVENRFASKLMLTWSSGSSAVELVGAGVTASACETSGCVDRFFDPATGTCVETTRADGAACSVESCAATYACEEGICLRHPRNPYETCQQPRLCREDGWCWDWPAPLGVVGVQLWGNDSRNVWLGGYPGRALHWNGMHWNEVAGALVNAEGEPGVVRFHGIDDRVWMIRGDGAVWTGTPARLNLVDETLGQDEFHGLEGVVALRDGGACVAAPRSPLRCFVRNAWREEGPYPALLFLDGPSFLQAIFSGSQRQLMERNASGWTPLQVLPDGDLAPAITWQGYRTAFAPDVDSRNFRQVGGENRVIPRPEHGERLWLGPNGETVAFGRHARRLVNGSWQTFGPSDSARFRAIGLWGASTNELWAIDVSGLAKWDGSKWFIHQERTEGQINHLSVSPDGHWWAATSTGLMREEGELGWQPVTAALPQTLTFVSAVSASEACVIDDTGRLYQVDGTSSAPLSPDDTSGFRTVVCEPSGVVWLGGSEGRLLRRSRQGEWQTFALGEGPLASVRRIVPTGDTSAWVLVSRADSRGSSRVFRFDNGSVQMLPEASSLDVDLRLIEGVPVALSVFPTAIGLRRWVDTHWELIATRSFRLWTDPNQTQFWGDRLDDLWVSGPDRVSHWNGSTWEVFPLTHQLVTITGDAESIRVGGLSSTILRRSR